MTQPLPKMQEEYIAKIPALTLLSQLGWEFLTPKEATQARQGKRDQVVLREVLRQELQKRRFEFAGKMHSLSEKSINFLINQICSPALNEGLLAANEKLYNHLMLGISVTEFIDGKKATPTIPIIDWASPTNNRFLLTEEFSVTRAGGAGFYTPDIVCFVNGIPLVVIEAKKPAGKHVNKPSVDEGIRQTLRNQAIDGIPQLFAYNQLVLSVNGFEGRYGTCETKKEFWSVWKEEDFTEQQMHAIKNQALSKAQIHGIFAHRSPEKLDWYRSLIAAGDVTLSDQDRLIISLLSPQRLLNITRYFMLFDNKKGKIVARYQQMFGVNRLLERIQKRRLDGGREGGVIWHTTGSGKSYSMVFLSKALLLHENLKQCRLVLITDRLDLERQLSRTFSASGELDGKKDKKTALMTSGKALAEQIGTGTSRLVFSLVQKFTTAVKLPECVNTSPDMIVLVDEGHRTQDGENHVFMRRALPNAAFVAFTGTPLLKKDKTVKKFGPILHAYTMQEAVADKAVSPLLYEERIPDLDVNDKAIDIWFARFTEGLSSQQKADLKRKYSRKGEVYKSEDRIQLIALDIANHFSKNIDEGLKGQLACDSKHSAIRYKSFLENTGLFESAIVMSAPDTREGDDKDGDMDQKHRAEIIKWWKDNVGTQNETQYTKGIVERFENKDDPLKLIIVVDKLLTGFDEPQNAVLYIDKPLKAHNLIQAIARVNRLHELKKFGYLIDYRGILSELDTTIKKYQDLAERTQNGYSIEDIAGLYYQMNTEYRRLPQLYKDLRAIFSKVKNQSDPEQFKQVLIPKQVEISGEFVDANLKRREDFYQALTKFANCLKVALQSAAFYDDPRFSDADRLEYKQAVKAFSELRQWVKSVTGERVDYDKYEQNIKKLLDKHVVGVDIRDSGVTYAVNLLGNEEGYQTDSPEKTRTETDIIKTQITKSIEQTLADDPYAQKTFSNLLRQTIAEAEALFDHPDKAKLLFKNLQKDVQAGVFPGLPLALRDHGRAKAYWGQFVEELPEILEITDHKIQDRWIATAVKIDELVKSAIQEHSINLQNLESDLSQRLLPILLTACKLIGKGMDETKRIKERIIQIVRTNLSK